MCLALLLQEKMKKYAVIVIADNFSLYHCWISNGPDGTQSFVLATLFNLI